MCSFLISSRWFPVSLQQMRFEHKQTDGLATLTPLFSRYCIHIFQVFYPHFPGIVSTCSRYCIHIFQVFYPHFPGIVSTFSRYCIHIFQVFYPHFPGILSTFSRYCIHMFQVLYPHFPGILSTFSRYCIHIFQVLYPHVPGILSTFSRYCIHMFQVLYPHFPGILSTFSRYFIHIFQVLYPHVPGIVSKFSRYFIHIFQVLYPHFPGIVSTFSRYFIHIFQVLYPHVPGIVSKFSRYFIHIFQVLYPHFPGILSTFSRYCIHMFQVLYPHFPGILSTFSRYCIHIFQIFYQISPFFPDMHLPIPTGATWGCWGVSKHERRPAWPPVTAPTEKNSWELLAYMAWLVVKRCFWKYNEKETTNSQFGEWTYFPKFSTFWVFLPWSFFGSKKELSLSSDIQETSGDVKEEVGFVFWLANRRKCLLTIWGMDLEKGGGIFQHFFWKCCSWNFEWEVVFFNWMRWTTIAVKTFREGFFLKQGCLNQFGVQRIKMQILILCNGKGL